MLGKYIFPLLLTSVMLLTTAGCNKSSDEPVVDEYLVRYTATFEPGRQIDISYRNSDNKIVRVQRECPDGSFQATVGPVFAGFNADIVMSQTIGMESGTLSIEVSRNSGPFVMKASRDHAVTLEYNVGE